MSYPADPVEVRGSSRVSTDAAGMLDTIEKALEQVGIYLSWVPPGHAKAARDAEGAIRDGFASLRALVQAQEDALNAAVLLHVPGKWGREHGYDVPPGDLYEWDAARIRLFRSLGMDDLADHLTKDRLDVLEAIDFGRETTERADAFRAALAAASPVQTEAQE